MDGRAAPRPDARRRSWRIRRPDRDSGDQARPRPGRGWRDPSTRAPRCAAPRRAPRRDRSGRGRSRRVRRAVPVRPAPRRRAGCGGRWTTAREPHVSSYGTRHAPHARDQADSPWPWACSTRRIGSEGSGRGSGSGSYSLLVGVDRVGPSRPVGRDRAQRIGDGVDVGPGGAEAQAHARRARQALVVPGARLRHAAGRPRRRPPGAAAS